MNIVEVLRAARTKIASPDHWTKYTLARNVHGSCVDVNSTAAVRWCAIGAIETVASTRHLGEKSTAVKALKDALDTSYSRLGVSGYNDHSHTTHEMVLALFDHAIELLEPKSEPLVEEQSTSDESNDEVP